METKNKTADKVLILLIKEPFADHSATSVAKTLGITRQGLWKSLNKLSKDELISLKAIADTKKSAVNIKLNYKNSITEKVISLLLTKESLNYERWRDNFKKLEEHTLFIILFGSILHSPKQANDIDILVVVKSENNFKVVDKILLDAQQAQIKKIHAIDLTKEELKVELKKKNRAYLEALKKGVILFGQENFIKFIKDMLE